MRTGNFVYQLEGIARYKAFMPNSLPYAIKFTPKLQNLLALANIAIGRLDGMADILPNVDFFILMYIRKEATLSSQIEGTQATFVDVLKAEARVEGTEEYKDVDEVLNYISAMNYGIERVSTLPLSSRLIKEIHKELLKGVRGEWKTPGEFRKSQNWVGGPTIQTATYVPPPSEEVNRLMGNIENYLHNEPLEPTLIKAGLLHAQFETIHPFLDGNGRIGRLLITFYLCQQGILQKPLLYLSEFFKSRRRDYYEKLNFFRQEDDVEGWLEFYLEGVIETSTKAVETARKIRSLRDKNQSLIIGLGRTAPKAEKVHQRLYKTPILRIKDVEMIAGISNPNSIELIKKLERIGILKEITGKSRYKLYSYGEYVSLFS